MMQHGSSLFTCKSLWPVSCEKLGRCMLVYGFFHGMFFAKKGRTAKGAHIPNPCKIQREVVFYKLFSCLVHIVVLLFLQNEIKVLIFVSHIVNTEEYGNRKYQNKKCVSGC